MIFKVEIEDKEKNSNTQRLKIVYAISRFLECSLEDAKIAYRDGFNYQDSRHRYKNGRLENIMRGIGRFKTILLEKSPEEIMFEENAQKWLENLTPEQREYYDFLNSE